MKEGPSEYTIPARTIVTCNGCKYYDCSLWRSGRDPVYLDRCKHPNAAISLFSSNLETDPESGNVIPGKFCPFIKKDV